MRTLEWLVVGIVVAMAWSWLRGRRAGLWLGVAGVALAAVSVVVEGQRPAMWPAYLVVLVALVRGLRAPADASAPAGRWRTVGRVAWVAAVLVAAAGLPYLWPVMRLPAPTGPHPVGSTWLVVRDTTRAERFSRQPGARREFPVRVWYPAPAGATGPMAPYAEAREMTFGGFIPQLFMEHARLIRTHSMLDVPVASGTWPVLIFSHGYTSYAAQNTVQMEELASRGYVVASIAHPGEASWAPFPDGRGIPYDPAPMQAMQQEVERKRKPGADPVKMMDSVLVELAVADPVARRANFRAFVRQTPEPLRTESVTQWSLDTKALLDRLEGRHAMPGDSLFRGRLDLQHVGIFGMSYGGATAGEFCRLDPRCRAAINMDGTPFGGIVDDTLRVPLLIMASADNEPVHRPLLDLVQAPAFLLKVPGTNHVGLSDYSLQGPLLAWIGMTGRLDPARKEAIMTDFIIGFFETYLMGRSPERFNALAARYPDVGITRRNVP
jgi:predicted dienelactone hydrolase